MSKRRNKKSRKTQATVKRTGTAFIAFLALLGLPVLSGLIVLYGIFSSLAAETHFTFPNVPFPIFVGEVVLMYCGVIFLAAVGVNGFRWSVPVVIGLLYTGWVLVKTYAGFQDGGPIALRNAALFYYPFTAVFVWYMASVLAERNLFVVADIKRPSMQVILFGAAVLLGLSTFSAQMIPFARYYMIIAMIIIALNMRNAWIKALIGAVLAFVIIKSGILVCISRSHLVSLFAAIVFLGIYFYLLYRDVIDTKSKWIFAIIFMAIACGSLYFSDRNTVRSILAPDKILRLYENLDAGIKAGLPRYRPAVLPVCIYSNESGDTQADYCFPRKPIQDKPIKAEPGSPLFGHALQASGGDSYDMGEAGYRSLGTAYVNILFRYFIWRDMVEEFWQDKPVMGFGFDRTQRSKSLEILRWGESAWGRDGWVAPHNSLLHLIYRGGIVGLLSIAAILVVMIRLTRDFLRLRSVSGGLLMSVLVFGFASANFLVFLELPYMAMPFWFIFGLTCAYGRLRENSAGTTGTGKNAYDH